MSKTGYYQSNPTFASMETISEGSGTEALVCPACGGIIWKNAGQAKDYSVSGEWFELKECISCHLKATFPRPQSHNLGRYYASQNYISHSDTRSGLTNKLYHIARRYMLEKKYDWVSRASKKETGRLLDVGAGTGHFAHYMEEYHWDVTALEPDENARKTGSSKLNMDIQPIEILSQLTPESFDVITLWHVLEHVEDVTGYMSHFRSILRKEGVLIIAVPNYTSRDAKQYGMKWAAYDVPRHLWHFSPLSIERLLSNHGFRLLKKIPMPLDAFYVSMLSERYNGNKLFGIPAALLSGLRTYISELTKVDKASSIIYVAG